MKNTKVSICCICGASFEGFGNNPDGAVWKNAKGDIVEPTFKPEDRCCDNCDAKYVIPGRIYLLGKNRKEQ